MPSQAANVSSRQEVAVKLAAANCHVPLQGAQKDVQAPRHSEWKRIVRRPGIAPRLQNFRPFKESSLFRSTSNRCLKLAIFTSAFLPFECYSKHLSQIFCCCATHALARPGKRMEENSTPTS
eukprot:6476195-Amphidinium_carterae.1